MRARRVELLHAADLLAHVFERGGKHLFVLQGMLGYARKASAPGPITRVNAGAPRS
jgi:hypothetical protein